MIRIVFALLMANLTLPFMAPQAEADTLVWRMKSDHQYIVYVKFFSQRYERAWPGGGESYVFDDSRTHTLRLECESGEKICFGAFTKHESSVWGIGKYGDEGCQKCCRTCGSYYETIDVLN